jgi:hypothetical protein
MGSWVVHGTPGPACRGVPRFDPQPVGQGWVALRSNVLAPALLRSTDGIGWMATSIESTTETLAFRLVAGSFGYLVTGNPSCSPSSCGPITWWSGDGATWTRIPSEAALEGEGLLAAAGEHGFVVIDGDRAWASTTGWSWAPLPAPADGRVGVTGVVARGDEIVAVGGRVLPDGRSQGWIAVAQ